MATHRRRNIIASRRPIAEEGEEGGDDSLDLESLSDDSGLSEEYEDEEADEDDDDYDDEEDEDEVHNSHVEKLKTDLASGNKYSNKDIGKPTEAVSSKEAQIVANGNRSTTPNGTEPDDVKAHIPTGPKNKKLFHEPTATAVKDFFNGELGEPAVEAEFEEVEGIAKDTQTPELNNGKRGHVETPFERRKREHEEYKKKRDSDPTFIPNRGAFFMHDHRHSGNGPNGSKPFGRGRGGRGGIGGGFGGNGGGGSGGGGTPFNR